MHSRVTREPDGGGRTRRLVVAERPSQVGRYVGSLALLLPLLAISPLEGQTPEAVWTGSIRAPARETRLRAVVPGTTDRVGFRMESRAEDAAWTAVPVTDISFSGIDLSFRMVSVIQWACLASAVPARGYAGVCRSDQGDSVSLILMPPVAGMLLPWHEAELARSAAHPELAGGAGVHVLTMGGHQRAAPSSNGFECLIQRPTARDFWPICFNPPAATAMLPAELLRGRLRASGGSEQQIEDSVLLAYRAGQLRPPPADALALMLSSHAWTAHPTSDERRFLGPHMHLYLPNATGEALGVGDVAGARRILGVRLEREGQPDASITVRVPPEVVQPTQPQRHH